MLAYWEVSSARRVDHCRRLPTIAKGHATMTGSFSPPAAGARWASGLARTLAILAALFACTPASAGEPVAPDARITSTAHLLAGIGSDYKPHAQIAALDAWQKHRKQLAPRWARLQRERLNVIETWRNDALRAELDRCQSLLYPFSGPDFLNAYVLFPRCDSYVLFGLEAPGDVPALVNRGQLHLVRYEPAAAIADLEAAVRLRPTELPAWAIAIARFAAVVVFPSTGPGLVISTIFGGRSPPTSVGAPSFCISAAIARWVRFSWGPEAVSMGKRKYPVASRHS